MTTTLCVLALALFSILVKSKADSMKNFLPVFLLFSPLSVFAQNGEIGGGSNSEIIFWLFVLGFVVSIIPERKPPFQAKGMRVLKITILGVLLPLIGFAQLPDFSTARKFDTDTKIDGWNDNARPRLPVLNSCDFGDYDVYLYFEYKKEIWYYGKIPMQCLSKGRFPNAPLDDDDRTLWSTAIASNGYGQWYAVLEGSRLGCGYVYTYDIFEGGRFSWKLEKMVCK